MEDTKRDHDGPKKTNGVPVVREFQPGDKLRVHQIFYVGMMEMITDTAFRGLRHHPESLLLYSAITVVCYAVTMRWWVIGAVPALALCARYFCSRHVIYGYLEHAMNTDMNNIEEYYMKPADNCMWVAVLDDKVVGSVAALGKRESKGAVELQRMTVDPDYRRRGVGVALGRQLLEFAAARGFPAVVLGTTAYQPAAHKLYQRLGFRCTGVTNGHATPGSTPSLLEKMFYRVNHHHYHMDVRRSDQ